MVAQTPGVLVALRTHGAHPGSMPVALLLTPAIAPKQLLLRLKCLVDGVEVVPLKGAPARQLTRSRTIRDGRTCGIKPVRTVLGAAVLHSDK